MDWSCGITVVVLNFIHVALGSKWVEWWSYDGFSGPNNWGKVNPEYAMCRHGRHQSPINIEPQNLLFDPNLKIVQIDYATVHGILTNTGKDITFWLTEKGYNHINISLGPLSYKYRLSHIKLHFSNYGVPGSEHKIGGSSFPGEIQFIAYNSDLYDNFTHAKVHPKGLAVIAVFIKNGTESSRALEVFESKLIDIERKDSTAPIHAFSVEELTPRTEHYLTYSGSLTQPGCQETVTWIIFNKPIYLSNKGFDNFRTRAEHEWTVSNTRPIMPINHRTVRTNINYRKQSRLCSMEREMFYQVNSLLGS